MRVEAVKLIECDQWHERLGSNVELGGAFWQTELSYQKWNKTKKSLLLELIEKMTYHKSYHQDKSIVVPLMPFLYFFK